MRSSRLFPCRRSPGLNLGITVWVSLVLLAGCRQENATGPGGWKNSSSDPVNVSGDDRSTKGATRSPASIRFVERGSEWGIKFVHDSGDNAEKPFPAANGSGVAALDYDLDGWTDLLFLTGRDFPLSTGKSGPSNQLYRNVADDAVQRAFRNRTEQASLSTSDYCAGVAVGDLNHDGFPDIYVNCFGRNLLFFNNGDGTFFEAAVEAGVADDGWGTSTACLDFDQDGDLDLYVCRYAEWSWETNQFCGNRQENVRIFCSPRSVKPVADRLYENLGDGTFVDALQKSGLNRSPGRGQGVVAADMDGDALVDLYIGNDANANFLFRNRGDGSFEDLSERSGTAHDYAGRAQAGMGVDVADINRDGLFEIFVTNYEDEHNALYVNLGENFFQDESQSQGMAAPSLQWVGWGAAFEDLDQDGWQDLVITNGHTDDNLHDMGRDAEYEQPALLFENQRGRLQLPEGSAGDYFETNHPGRSLCMADLDRDGMPDIVIGHQDRSPAVLQNTSSPPDRKILCLRLIGTESNREGIGAMIESSGEAVPMIRRPVKSGGSYLAAQPAEVTISLDGKNPSPLQVRWPSGRIVHLPPDLTAGCYAVSESGWVRSTMKFSPSFQGQQE